MSPIPRRVWLIGSALGLTLLFSYWPTLKAMAERWWRDPQYSHGFLVPGFAALILWFRRARLAVVVLQTNWWGLAFLATGLALRLAGAAMDVESVDGFSLLPTLAGLVLLLGGRQVFAWSWPAIAFLAFMLPMPFFLETALGRPLRHIATVASTYVLQTLGFPAFAEGNIIHIDQIKLGVVDACSGLGMLVTFFALSTAMALIVRAPLGDKMVLVLSAIPIAIIANVVRITATAIAHSTLGSEAGNAVMHDLAGWLMMPLALGLMWLELRLLDRLFPPTPDKPLAPVSISPFNPEPTATIRNRANALAVGSGPNHMNQVPSLPAQGR
jgi:exosortase